ncbi:MAG: NYN domain-containing protein, partial [Acidobacteriota bacterium]
MSKTEQDTVQRIALFIDFDNGQLDISKILTALRERGIILIKKAYGDWQRFSQFRRVLAENGVDLVERPTIHAGGDKNGADIQLAVDALEACLNNPHIDVFAIASGDSDFLPLISRLQAYNKKVVIIGMRQTTSSVVMRNCNEYIAYENILKNEAQEELLEEAAGDLDLKSIDASFKLLRRAMDLLEDEGRSVNSSMLKQRMLQLSPAFDEKTYGFEQFKEFLAEAQRRKIIHLGKKMEGSYSITLGRKGRELEPDAVDVTHDTPQPPPKRRRSQRSSKEKT